MRRAKLPGAALLLAAAAVLAAAPQPEDLTIGLFIPTRGDPNPLGVEILKGAEAAADRINRNGGVGGRRLRLVVASSDLPWQGAGRDLVRIIYDEGAEAIVGAPDGRSAHLAEQIVARARGTVVFVTPWATETTLTRVRVPWFFQVPPDDRRQATALVREIFEKRRIRRAAIWTEDSFDGRSRAEAFLRAAPAGSATVFEGEDPKRVKALAEEVARGEFGALLLLGSPGPAADLIGRTVAGNRQVLVLGPLALAVPEFLATAGSLPEGRVLIVVPGGAGETPAARAFARDFLRLNGRAPTLAAALSHDAVCAVAAAFRRVEQDPRTDLPAALAGVTLDGASGPLRFDRFLGRDGEPSLAEVRGGERFPHSTGAPSSRK